MNKYIQASFTVEAAFIMPIIIAMMVLSLGTGIDLHNQVCDSAGDIAMVQEIDSVKLFRTINGAKTLVTEVVGED